MKPNPKVGPFLKELAGIAGLGLLLFAAVWLFFVAF